jgi:hypothetical protein
VETKALGSGAEGEMGKGEGGEEDSLIAHRAAHSAISLDIINHPQEDVAVFDFPIALEKLRQK